MPERVRSEAAYARRIEKQRAMPHIRARTPSRRDEPMHRKWFVRNVSKKVKKGH